MSMSAYSLLTVAILLGICFTLIVQIWRAVLPALARQTGTVRIACLAGVVFAALLLFRPHEDTFVGIDTSAFRLLSQSIQQEQSFYKTDEAWKALPQDFRQWMIFRPSFAERYTRNRIYEITDRASGASRPFFYPLLPLAMSGFDLLVPGQNADYLLPFVGWLFMGTCFVVACALGGGLGLLFAMALLIGSPLPVWLFRGAVLESVSAILMGFAVLRMLVVPGHGRHVATFAALGLAASFHPLMLLPALGQGFLWMLRGNVTKTIRLLHVIGFAAGLVPLILLTAYVTQPYGSPSWASLVHNIRVSPSHRLAVYFAASVGCGGLLLMLTRRCWIHAVARLLSLRWLAVGIWILAWCIPFASAAWLSREAVFIQKGFFSELLNGMQWPLGLVVLTSLALLLSRRGAGHAKAMIALIGCCLPVFCYLAGKEHIELWSQRRLLMPVLWLFAILIGAVSPLVAKWGDMTRWTWARRVLALVLIGAACTNAVRWPAPYVVRYEAGAGEWIKNVNAEIGDALTVFDYFPYSVPFALSPDRRLYGITDTVRSRKHVFAKRNFAENAWPKIVAWLRERAGQERVCLVSAFASPGLEQGVRLVERSHERVALDRVTNKRVLPVRRKVKQIDVHILDVQPISAADAEHPLALHKVMDGGFLALRPPWGRHDRSITLPDKRRLPAIWSREGSGFVGPVPREGEHVEVVIAGSAPTRENPSPQRLLVQAPWDAPRLEMIFSNRFMRASGLIEGSPESAGLPATAVYRLYVEQPYDPSLEGLRGYASDLGILVHAIDMVLVQE